jgi:hypothetical protein
MGESELQAVKSLSVLSLPPDCQKEGKTMSKHYNNGSVATESYSDAVILSDVEKKVELPVFAEMTGLTEAVTSLTGKMSTIHEKINDVATASEKASAAQAELKTLGDTPTGKLLLALAGDKIQNLDAQLTDSAKKAVEVEILATRQLMKNVGERIDAIEAKFGMKPATPSVPEKGQRTVSKGKSGKITEDVKVMIQESPDWADFREAFKPFFTKEGDYFRIFGTGHNEGTVYQSNLTNW